MTSSNDDVSMARSMWILSSLAWVLQKPKKNNFTVHRYLQPGATLSFSFHTVSDFNITSKNSVGYILHHIKFIVIKYGQMGYFSQSCKYILLDINFIFKLLSLVIFFPTFYGESYELRFAIRTFPVIVQSTIISQHMVPFSWELKSQQRSEKIWALHTVNIRIYRLHKTLKRFCRRFAAKPLYRNMFMVFVVTSIILAQQPRNKHP